MKIILTIAMAIFIAVEPVQVGWKRLADVRFSRRLNSEVNMYFLYPAFGPSVTALQGKEIVIRGYMIPVDESDNIYVVSAKPMASCFFCGGSGPESIVELQFRKKKQRFRTDEVRSIRGRLVLNTSDIDHLNYILQDAEMVD